MGSHRGGAADDRGESGTRHAGRGPTLNPAVGLQEKSMNEEIFNASIRKFLKTVGVNSQREIERAVADAVAVRLIAGTESFPATVSLVVPGLKLDVKFEGEIRLD
jgi:hypothetical protein